MLEWSYSGVNFSLYGNGGSECAHYLPNSILVFETLLIVTYALLFELYYPWKRSVCNYKPNLELRERFGRKLLLAGLCLIWGIEIGYKLSTRQLIFILNPCHMVTLLQLILLISPARRWMHFMFRIQTYLISGATIAIIFPVLNTRHLPFEVASYYIHHVLMLVTPLYLMRLGGIYNMEPLFNFHWAFMALGVLRIYHYLVLQPLSFVTEVNLNSMMCPAISDPFAGPWYRLAANIHQTFFFILHGKIYCFLGHKFFAPSAKSAALAAEYYNIMRKVSESYRDNCSGSGSGGGSDKNGRSQRLKIVSYDERDEDEASTSADMETESDTNLACKKINHNNNNGSSTSAGSTNKDEDDFDCQHVGAVYAKLSNTNRILKED